MSFKDFFSTRMASRFCGNAHSPREGRLTASGRGNVCHEVAMRIANGQVLAGYPALAVRTFLRRCRPCTIVPATAAYDLKFDEREGSVFLRGLTSLALIEPADHMPRGETEAYEITGRGLAFANASAARPITRRTAESALAQFMKRLHAVNANAEYLYRVESAMLIGSLLTEIERLGDVDLAVKLSPKVTEDEAFNEWCDRRRHAAQQAGQRFRSTFDWVVWSKKEIFQALRGRSRILSIHKWDQITKMADVRYRVVWGDPKRIARLITNGKPC